MAAVNAQAKADKAIETYKKSKELERRAEQKRERELALAKSVEQKAHQLALKAEAAQAEASTMKQRLKKAKCRNNPGCKDMGLVGYCCPTLNGIHLTGITLSCCNHAASADDLATTTDK